MCHVSSVIFEHILTLNIRSNLQFVWQTSVISYQHFNVWKNILKHWAIPKQQHMPLICACVRRVLQWNLLAATLMAWMMQLPIDVCIFTIYIYIFISILIYIHIHIYRWIHFQHGTMPFLLRKEGNFWYLWCMFVAIYRVLIALQGQLFSPEVGILGTHRYFELELSIQ